MSRVLEGLSNLPWGVHALVAVGMAAGLILWLAGQRVLKPLLITAIVLFGGLLGGLIVPSASWGASLTIGHGIGMGLVAGLLVGLLLYRSAMAVGFGVVMGAALPLMAASALQFYPIAGSGGQPSAHANIWHGPEDAWERVSALTDRAGADALPGGVRIMAARWMDDAPIGGREALAAFNPDHPTSTNNPTAVEKFVPPELRPAADRIGEVWSDASTRAREEWGLLPSAHRAIIGLAAVIGLAGGVVAGLVMPTWAGSTVTALFGSAVWLPCFVWLSNAFGAPWRSWLDRAPASWLAIWGVAALLGMIFQWRTAAARKAKTATATASPA